ncbi:hypothetical protein SVIOM342S_03823 [Streptomyces violaceorubidus]
MARHASPRTPHTQRALVALATAGAALAAGAATASADGGETIAGLAHTRPTSLGNIDPQAGLAAVTGTVGYVTGPVDDLKPNSLAGTGVDPLDNGVGTKVADFQPLDLHRPDRAGGPGAVARGCPGGGAGDGAAALTGPTRVGPRTSDGETAARLRRRGRARPIPRPRASPAPSSRGSAGGPSNLW